MNSCRAKRGLDGRGGTHGGRGDKPMLPVAIGSPLPTLTWLLSLGGFRAPWDPPNLVSSWVFLLPECRIGAMVVPCFPMEGGCAVPASPPCLAPCFLPREGGVVTAGRCLCSNVSLGLSQARPCSSCPSLANGTCVSLTAPGRMCRLADAGKFLPKG